jgi:transposase
VFIEFTLSQRKAEFYRGLVNALTFFGGSPRNLIFDFVPGHKIEVLFPTAFCGGTSSCSPSCGMRHRLVGT